MSLPAWIQITRYRNILSPYLETAWLSGTTKEWETQILPVLIEAINNQLTAQGETHQWKISQTQLSQPQKEKPNQNLLSSQFLPSD